MATEDQTEALFGQCEVDSDRARGGCGPSTGFLSSAGPNLLSPETAVTDLAPLQHWLVAVARRAGLPRAATLDVPSAADTDAAWDTVALATGVTPDTLADVVSVHFGLPRADFGATDVAAIPLLPPRVADRLGVLVVSCTDREAVVASADPVAFEAEQEIAGLTSRHVRFAIAPPAAIRDALKHAYSDDDRRVDEEALPALLADDAPHVLVVDDDADVRLLLRTVLQARDFRVSEAEDGESALRILESEGGIHLVTLDLKMGEMDGLDVLKRIRSRLRTRSLPVVVATGVEDPEVEMRLFEAGADDFVVKPIDPPRFILRIQAVLRRRDRGDHPLLR